MFVTMLTAKQEAFCQHYALHRNPGAAYRHGFEVSGETLDSSVRSMACELLENPAIAQRVDELIAEATAQAPAVMTLTDCMTWLIEAIMADPNELIGMKVGACRYCYGDGHGYQWREREFLEATDKAERLAKKDPDARLPDIGGGFGYRANRPPHPDCPECEGEGVRRVVPRDTSKLSPGALKLFGGVKEKKDGVEVIVADRAKLLEMLVRMQGGFKDNVKMTGQLQQLVAAVTTVSDDPNEAARIYQQMVSGLT